MAFFGIGRNGKDRGKQIMSKVERLPALPAVVSQILELTNQPDFPMERLVQVVNLDPGITANVLAKANSAFFGFGAKIGTLQQALNRLGVQNIVDIALSQGVAGLLSQDLDGYRLDRGQLWRHSLATALVARRLAQHIGLESAGEIYTAALLHDVGKLILATFVQEEFAAIHSLVEQDGWPLIAAEREILGVDHAALGAAAAKKWRLAGSIQTAIRCHHRPEDALPTREDANLVCLANHLAVSLGVGSGFGDAATGFSSTTLFDMGLTLNQLEPLRESAADLLERAAPLFDMVGV